MAVVALAILLLVLPLAGAWGLPYHLACERVSAPTPEVLWTPVVIADAPHNGTINATGILMNGGDPIAGAAGSVHGANGSSVGLFALASWRIYSTSTRLELGPGSPDVCRGSLVAVMAGRVRASPTGNGVTPLQLAGPGSFTSHDVPIGFSLQGYGSVEWNLDYNASQPMLFGHGTCGGGAIEYSTALTQLHVSVPYRTTTVGATVSTAVDYEFTLSPNGNWFVQASPSGAYAFDYYSCSAGS